MSYTKISLADLGLPAGNNDIQVRAVAQGFIPSPLTPQGQIIYVEPGKVAVFSDNWKQLLRSSIVLYNITSIKFSNNLNDVVGLVKLSVNVASEGNIDTYINNNTGAVVFYSSSTIYAPINCYRLLSDDYGLQALQTIDLSNFNTSNVTNMSSMFWLDEHLTQIIGLENFNTSNVTDISFMFTGCFDLGNLNLSSWDTSSLTTVEFAFLGCSMSELNLNGWDLSHLTNSSVPGIQFMFGLDDYVVSNIILQQFAPQYKSYYDTAVANNDLNTKKEVLRLVLQSFGFTGFESIIVLTNIGVIKSPLAISSTQMIPLPYATNGFNSHYAPDTQHFLIGNNTTLTRV